MNGLKEVKVISFTIEPEVVWASAGWSLVNDHELVNLTLASVSPENIS